MPRNLIFVKKKRRGYYKREVYPLEELADSPLTSVLHQRTINNTFMELVLDNQ